MKSLKILAAQAILLVACISALADVPKLINYHGRLTTPAGVPVPNATYPITFTIWDVPAGGSPLWSEIDSVVTNGGLFLVQLGTVTTLPDNIFDDTSRYIGITVSPDQEIVPRQRLVSTPYSYRVRTVDGATGGVISGSLRVDGIINAADIYKNGLPFGGWALTGNAGTIAGTSFMGTSDAQALDIRTNNILRARITTKGQIETYNTGRSVFVGEGAGANDDLFNRQNVFVGYMAGFSNTTGTNNTANGTYALSFNTTGLNNTANGVQALYSNTTGIHNTANGSFALFSNTAGVENTANGNRALFSNTTGYFNTANGSLALFSNTTGTNNTANGSLALYSNTTGIFNTANGYAALYANTTGSSNTANGANALYFNTSGINNTALGYQAGNNNSTGGGNVFIGYRAGYFEFGSNKLYIANSSANPPLIYGDFSTGRVGVGTTAPAHPLHLGSGAHVTVGGVWTNASSRELKTDIEPLKNDEYADILEKLEDLEVVHFKYKAEPDVAHIGMIAEDVPEEMASPDRTGIPTADAIAFLVAAVKAQQGQIEVLKATVKDLKEKSK